MITGRDHLLKTGGGTRSDSIGNKSRTGAKDVGHLMKLATSNPALSEPFHDTHDYVAVAANPARDWTSFSGITEPGCRSGAIKAGKIQSTLRRPIRG